MFTEGTIHEGMVYDEWGDAKGRLFEPVDEKVESLAPFKLLRTKMERLGWVYDGSLRWSHGPNLLLIAYSEDESFMELWHSNNETRLKKRVHLDCNDRGIDSALKELNIVQQ